MKIFIINGLGGCGKDSFIKFCAEDYNIAVYSTADLAKTAMKSIGLYKGVKTFLGWVEETDKCTKRQLLSAVKDAIDKDDFVSCNYIISAISGIKDLNTFDACFIHSRQQEDIQYLQYNLDCQLVWVNREVPVCDTERRFVRENNISYDIIVDNNSSLEELRNKAISFMNQNVQKVLN